MSEEVPVEDIMRILNYLNDEETNYDECEVSEQMNHVYKSMEKVDMWLARNYHEERSLAIDKFQELTDLKNRIVQGPPFTEKEKEAILRFISGES